MENGHKEKLLALYKDHYPSLLNYGIKIIRDEDVVKDCIQDCFYDLWTNPDKLERADSIRNYLIGTLRNLVLKQVAKSSKIISTSEVDSFEISVEDSIIQSENKEINNQKLQQAISMLSPKQKEVLYLRFYERLSYSEIEKITSTNYQSVRNLLSKAIKNLRESIMTWLFFF